MNGLSYSQVSGNDWTTPPSEMLYQLVQYVVPTHVPEPQPWLDRQYAQRIQEQIEQQMARFEADHEAAVAELQRCYVFLNDQAIRGFFKSHRTAPQLLLEAVPHLRQDFGAGTVFDLRAMTDEYGAQTLYAVAMWPGSVRDVRIALDHFDEQWWIANSHQASGDLTFTYELV
ncbi:MAG: hypothetical protein ABSG07_14285 [Terriglobales bacterium]|jgi:hypothetical protein